MIKGVDVSDRMLQKYVASAVGAGIAVSFCAFLTLKNKIDFQAIIKNPALIEDITEIDMQYSLIALITEWLNANHDKKGMDILIDMLQHLQPEYAIITIKSAMAKFPNQILKHFATNETWTKKLASEYQKYIGG
jgi:hypothetical protein